MKSEENSHSSGPKKNTDDYTDHSNVGSVGVEGSQDNGASTLRELRRKHAAKMNPAAKPRKPML
jgi:hypothetical protein